MTKKTKETTTGILKARDAQTQIRNIATDMLFRGSRRHAQRRG